MDEEYLYELRIPRERLAVLIGTKGETKANLEQETNCKLDIDSKEGQIKIKGQNGLDVYNCREIVKAIGRGFNPEIAKLLKKQDYYLDIITILQEDKSLAERIKGRIIGEKGKAREHLEKTTSTNVSVYGKTVSIIGPYENVAIARQAIEKIIQGAPHAHVYSWLDRRMKELRREQLATPGF